MHPSSLKQVLSKKATKPKPQKTQQPSALSQYTSALSKEQQNILKKALVMSQSISPKREQKKTKTSTQIMIANSSVALSGANYLTPRIDDLQFKNKQYQQVLKTRTSSAEKGRQSHSNSAKRTQQSSNSRSGSKKMKLTMKKGLQQPSKDHLNLVIPTHQILINQGIQKVLASQQPSSTKSATAQTFQPLIDKTGKIKKITQVQQISSSKLKSSKNKQKTPNSSNNQFMMVIDPHVGGINQTNLSGSQGRDHSSASGRKIKLRTFESPQSSNNKGQYYKAIQASAESIQQAIHNHKQNSSNPQQLALLGHCDLSDKSPNRVLRTATAKKSQEYVHQFPQTTTNAAKKNMQFTQQRISLRRNSQKRAGSKDNDSTSENRHLQSLQEPTMHSDVLTSLATMSQRGLPSHDFYKAAELLQKQHQKFLSNKSNKKKKGSITILGSSNLGLNTMSICSNDQSTQRQQLKIKPPKHSFNQGVNKNLSQQPSQSNTQTNTNLTSPTKLVLQNNKMITPQQMFLSSLASKTSYNPQNYFQSAKLLNKQKQQMTQSKSRNNQQFMMLSGVAGQSSPLMQNWSSQFGNATQVNPFATDIMIGSNSNKNLIQNTMQPPSKNKTLNPTLGNFSTSSHQNFDQILQKEMSNPQQIQAAIIKKIQNNFQLSFTNSFNHQLGTQQLQSPQQQERSSPPKNPSQQFFDPLKPSQIQHQLNEEKAQQEKLKADQIASIEHQLLSNLEEISTINQSNESQSDKSKRKLDAYLKVLEDISHQDPSYKSLMSKVKKGMKETFKEQDQIQEQTKQKLKEAEFMVKEKAIEIKKIEQDLRDIERNENETRGHIQAMTQQIDERDDMIENLEIELDNQRRKYKELFKQQMSQPYQKSTGQHQQKVIIPSEADSEENQILYEQLQEAGQEVSELKTIIKEMQEELDYGKQRENKLMFFLFILKEKGFPISEVFEEEIKDIPTTRFSTHFDDEYKTMYYQLKQERKALKKQQRLEKEDGGFGILRDEVFALSPQTERVYVMPSRHRVRKSILERVLGQSEVNTQGQSKIDFDQVPFLTESNLTDSNYVPVTVQKPQEQKRPSIVPKLDLLSLPLNNDDSSTSSEDSNSQDEGNKNKKGRRGPNPRQVKKILDKYNIMTCARNIIEAEKTVQRKRLERAANAVRKSTLIEDSKDFKQEPVMREMLISQIDSEYSSQKSIVPLELQLSKIK